MKKCCTTTIRHHLNPVRMIVFEKIKHIVSASEDVGEKEPLILLVGRNVN